MDLKDDMAENLPKKKKSSKKGFFSEEIGHVNDPETKNETSAMKQDDELKKNLLGTKKSGHN